MPALHFLKSYFYKLVFLKFGVETFYDLPISSVFPLEASLPPSLQLFFFDADAIERIYRNSLMRPGKESDGRVAFLILYAGQ